nr:transposase [Escherichia coli]
MLMAEACNIGLEPLIRSNVPALTRQPAELDKSNYLRAETITSANARLVDFQQRCHWHRYGVEEKWHLQMECALLRQSEQSMPDRTANTW